MSFFLEPAVRMMNRLNYVSKFAVVGLLIIVQAFVLIYMLVSELNKNIEFAERERFGVQSIQDLALLLDEAQAYRSAHYAFALGDTSLKQSLVEKQAKIDAGLELLQTRGIFGADPADTAWKVQMLRQEWATRKQEAFQFEPERAQVALDLDSRWIRSLTDLMQNAGYVSNLAMDADFDTSYLVDSVLRKVPGLLDTLGLAQGLAMQLSDVGTLSAERKNELLQVAVIVRSHLEQTDQNAQLVFRRNEKIAAGLKPLLVPVTDSVPIFIWNLEQKILSTQGMPIPQQLVMNGGSQAIQSTLALYKADLRHIDELLGTRIERYSYNRNAVLVFTGGILLLVCYLFLAFDMSIRKGVYQLNGLMKKAGSGDLNARGSIYSDDEMGSLTQSINTMLDSLQKMVEEVQLSHDRLESWNQELEQKVAERTMSLRSLLDNAGQGFLSFSDDLKVAGEYSAECTTIFHQDIAGQFVPDLLFPDDKEQQVFLEAVFSKVFQERNAFLQETYFSLLPAEVIFGDRYIGMGYKRLAELTESGRQKIMLILTDRTEQKAMEDRVQEERNVVAMIVHVVTHSTDFFAAIRQYTEFCQDSMPAMLNEEDKVGENLTSLFRIIHTFKGTFGQLHMVNLVAKLHEMENTLDNLRSAATDTAQETLLVSLSPFSPDRMVEWLRADLAILEDKLGETFFLQENMLVIENERLLEIEEKVMNLLSPVECSSLLPSLRRLRYKPIKQLLQSYPEYVCGLAERNGKAIKPFDIEGGDILVDPEHYYDFVKSLGHIFRNAVVHGMESFDERLQNGKEEIGTVSCLVEEEPGGLRIVIADDGCGIDPARIRESAIQKRVCDEETLLAMPDDEVIQLIFADGFSSANEVGELAGRGVGLSSVRAELQKLGGEVHVTTTAGRGSAFHIFLPLVEFESAPYSLRQFGPALLAAAEETLQSAVGLAVIRCLHTEESSGGKLNLRRVSTFLGIKGTVGGRIIVSADQQVVERMALGKSGEEIGDPASAKKLENVLAQYADQLFQQAIHQLPHWADMIVAEGLVTILADDASAKYLQSATSTWLLETDAGLVTLSLVMHK